MAYIHESARGSYRHWWEQQTQSVWWYEDHQNICGYRRDIQILYPHLFPESKRKRRKRSFWSSNRTRRLMPWDVSTSGESSFRQNGCEPKVECPDAAWREHKQIKRDKAKRKQHRRYDHAGKWGKRMVHHKRRRHERAAIHDGRYEDITSGVQDIVRCWWD